MLETIFCARVIIINLWQGSKLKKRDNNFFKNWKLPKIGGRNRLQQPPQQQQQLGLRGRTDLRLSGNDLASGDDGQTLAIAAQVLFSQKTYFYFIDFTDTFVLQHFRHFRCISWIGKLLKRRNFEDPTYRFTLSHASRKSKKYFQSDLLCEAAETSDDILAKYRKRPTAAAVNDEDLIDLSNSNGVILHEGNRAQVSII